MNVVHCKKDKYDVYIGRPSQWGNPFEIGKDGTRSEVIKKYKNYAREKFSKSELLELDGKILGCYCRPKKCHGDALIELIDEIKNVRF